MTDLIQDEDLIFHSKFRGTGQFASGTTPITVSGSVANNTTASWTSVIPITRSGVAHALVYYYSDAWAAWIQTPDTFDTGAPDFWPLGVAAGVTSSALTITVTRANTSGVSNSISSVTYNFRYFLFI